LNEFHDNDKKKKDYFLKNGFTNVLQYPLFQENDNGIDIWYEAFNSIFLRFDVIRDMIANRIEEI
jgi:hypothetical protein